MITGLGKPVRRKEDRRFLSGTGNFTSDINVHNQAHLYVLRANVAHAQIVSIETSAAKAAEGVVAVFTAADLADGGIKAMQHFWQVFNPDGSPMHEAPRDVLAIDRVRYVGEPVVAIVAESTLLAKDASELVEIEYDELPAVTAVTHAGASSAPQVWEHIPHNLCFEWAIGDADATNEAFARAAFTVETNVVQNRLVPNPLEPRAALAQHDTANDEFTLTLTHQNPHLLRNATCSDTFPMPESKLRVISPDVGGGFGGKIYQYAEYLIALFAARATGRPVKWVAERSEAFMSDAHARDHATTAALAVDENGAFLGMRVRTAANLGAAISDYGAGIPTVFYAPMLGGVYTIPTFDINVKAYLTNTVPTDAYRGAGRPEATFVLERLVDLAAEATGIDRIELRRRNFIPPEAFPYQSPLGLVYDSGAYNACVDLASNNGDYAGYPERKATSESNGRLRGLGLITYTEQAGAGPSSGAIAFGAKHAWYEVTTLRVNPDGTATVITGSHSHGQSHETTFAQVAAAQLGIPIEDIEVVHGDTARVPFGIGTYASRSMSVGGSALLLSGEKVITKGKKIAAHMLDADADDIEFLNGHFRVAGTDRLMSFKEIAQAAYVPANYPSETLEPGLEETTYYDPPNFTFPAGCHICEVEIDPETGVTTVERYTVADDFGVVINPMVVRGQVHGGLAQGIGQALHEQTVYEEESGQLLTASFLDYTLPRADDLPNFEVAEVDSVSPSNPLGAKGCGEAGTIGAPIAVMNAVFDALKPLGVKDLNMPATPQKVWSAIDAAQNKEGQ